VGVGGGVTVGMGVSATITALIVAGGVVTGAKVQAARKTIKSKLMRCFMG